MGELVKAAVFLGVGLASGAVFFGALDRLNAWIAQRGGPRAMFYFVLTLVVRFALLGVLLFGSVRSGVHCLLAAFVGFMIARAVCLRFFPPAEEEED